ncbi:MAG: TRAP transporter small permease subunit [Burkholderiales bacterium]|nr:TRAP transporter small permease subunit [Pseudomonadota bacterium]
MYFLLRIAAFIDALNERIGRACTWLVLIAVLVSSGNAVSRYTFGMSSNAFLEIQWYLFAAIFLLAAGYTHRHDGHVRVDVFYSRCSKRTRAWIDIFGGLLFLLPMAIAILWLSWPMAASSFQINEGSPDPGGLLRWPVKLMIPLGFALLTLQAIAEIIKKAATITATGSAP